MDPICTGSVPSDVQEVLTGVHWGLHPEIIWRRSSSVPEQSSSGLVSSSVAGMARSHCCFPSATKHASPFVDKQSGEVFSRGPTTTHRWSMRPPRMQRRRRASPSSPVETLAIPPRRIRGSEGSPDGRGSWDDRSLPLQSLDPRSLKFLDGCDCSRRKNRNSKCSNRETSAHLDVMASAAAAPRQQQFC